MNMLESRRLFIATSYPLFYLSTYLSLCGREGYADLGDWGIGSGRGGGGEIPTKELVDYFCQSASAA
jgi:hypothetical protein